MIKLKTQVYEYTGVPTLTVDGNVGYPANHPVHPGKLVPISATYPDYGALSNEEIEAIAGEGILVSIFSQVVRENTLNKAANRARRDLGLLKGGIATPEEKAAKLVSKLKNLDPAVLAILASKGITV